MIDWPGPSVMLTLTCGHEIHMLIEDHQNDPWWMYDRSRYEPQWCVMRACRRFGIRQHPVARVRPFYPRAYKKAFQA